MKKHPEEIGIFVLTIQDWCAFVAMGSAIIAAVWWLA